jgi:subtilisin family serine protease
MSQSIRLKPKPGSWRPDAGISHDLEAAFGNGPDRFASDAMNIRPLRFFLPLAASLTLLAHETVRVMVALEGDPVAELTAANRAGGAARAGLSRAVAARRTAIAAQHAEFKGRLAAVGAEVQGEFDTLVNAVVLRVPADQLDALRDLPGVTAVRPVRQHERHLESSTPFLGGPAAWRSLPTGLTGKGVKIGIIDTGIDYHHAMFGGSGNPEDYANNDPDMVEPGSFPTAKVAGGVDLVGDDYPGAVPRRDADPLDPDGHGSHVAGIAAGFGVLKGGATYRGGYTQLSDFNQFQIGPGVAPEATLYAIKVFGRFGGTDEDITIQALEWALDPNRDGNFSDRMDVVNLSLGSSFGDDDPDDLEAAAVNRLTRNGILACISAGNSGNTYYVNGRPANAVSAITVANSFDNGASFPTLLVVEPLDIAGAYDFEEGAFTRPLSETGPVRGTVVYVDPPDACSETITNAPALQGKIALIDRGTCFFVDKIRRAQKAGAIAVIMVNNVNGDLITMGGQADDITIPGVMISRADGNIIKSKLAEEVTVELDSGVNTTRPELADHIAESSSRGPVRLSGRLKPDIAAPGSGIQSARAGSGTEGERLTGTSMSAPQVAGAAALVRQARPTWKPEDIKAVLMNTAVGMLDGQKHQYPESRVGAGRLNVGKAATTLVTARADTSDGIVSLSWGFQAVRQQTRLTNRIRLDNFGGTGVTFQVAVSNTVPQPGAVLSVLANDITVPAGGSATVPVVLDIDPEGLRRAPDLTSEPTLNDRTRFTLPEAGGQVWFTAGNTAIHVPWHVIVRATATWDMLALAVGLPTTNRFELPMPTRGPTGQRRPIVSAFQYGGTKGGVSAFGAATDFPTKQSVASARVWFGVALTSGWETPQRGFEGRLVKTVDVEIDPLGGATAAYSLINSTAGNVRSQEEYDVRSANDALVTAIRNERKTTDRLSVAGPLGGIEPAVLDLDLYHNAVLVHSALASEIGITANRTRFRYRVIVDQTDATDWVFFDLAKPVVDPTLFGLEGAPFFDEGREVRMRFDRSEALAAGLTGTTAANSPRVLLLHHHNQAGAQVDNIRLDMTRADADNDMLPDLWELVNLGELTTNATADPDGDGMTNAEEFAAGTNPNDISISGQCETAGPLAGRPSLRWKSVAGRFHTVERSESLRGPFTPMKRRVAATPPLNTFALPDTEPGAFFYRVTPD